LYSSGILAAFLHTRMPSLIYPCFQGLIHAQSALNGIDSSISLPVTNYPGIACNVAWYILRIAHEAALMND
jgi:hypothetical protein